MSAPTLHATIELARRVDGAEIDFCVTGGSTRGAIAVLEAGGGKALRAKPGSPLNKVLGLGLYGPVRDADLDAVEAFYREAQIPAQVELCPLAATDLAPRLCARGFVVQGFENELAAPLDRISAAVTDEIEVRLATPAEEDRWVRVVAEGFHAAEAAVGGGAETGGPPPSLDDMVAMMASFTHPEIARWLAFVEGEPAGGTAAWNKDGVLGIFGAATLPAFRRRGVQTALTATVVQQAKGAADLAIATTAPGSTSQRTFERLGFRVIYTRTIFVKSWA